MKFKDLIISEKKYLYLIFFVSLAVRLVYVLHLGPEKISPDASEWMANAISVATGNGYGDTWRPPGFITFLGIIFFIFGKSVAAVRIANSILGAFTCVLVYLIAKKTFSNTAGKISSLLFAFYPYSVAYTGDVLSETFYTFLIAVSVLFILKCSELPNFKNIFIAGICMGITGLTKSTIMPFFLFACAWLWWRTKSFKVGFFVGIFTLVAIMPWTIRNHFYYKKVIPVSTMWRSFYGSACDNAIIQESVGELDTPQPQEITAMAIPADYNEILKLPRMEQERVFKERSITWLKKNPGKFIWLIKKRAVHFWRLYPMQAYKWQKYAAMATSGIYIPLCFVGILLSLKKNIEMSSLLIMLFVLFTLVHVFFVVVLRYRVPIDPYIIIFAAHTIDRAYAELNTKYLRSARGKK